MKYISISSKYILGLLLNVLVTTNLLYGQETIVTVGNNKGTKMEFLVEKRKSAKYSRLSVIPKSTTITNFAPKDYRQLQINDGVQLKDIKIVPKIFKEVLGNKYSTFGSQNLYLIVNMYPDQRGKVTYVDYLMDENVRITISELERITNRLLSEVKITVPSDNKAGENIAPISQSIKFR